MGQSYSSQLLRFESLGDNCELGFALRALGCEFGGLLKWARSEPDQVAKLIRAGFAGSYLFDNLLAHRDNMVLDADGIAWHTEMYSAHVGRTRIFVKDMASRREIWQGESKKMRYLEARLRQRLQAGGSIFVIKSNAGISAEAMDDLHAALASMAHGAAFSLLEVCPAQAGDAAGTARLLGPSRLRGFVSQFAGYDNAAALDVAAWQLVLRQAMQLQPCAEWGQRMAELRSGAASLEINLLFPERPEPDLAKPIYADLRAGWAKLEQGSTWCRKVEEMFRLHAPPPGEPPAVLSWSAVRAPGAFRLVTAAQCAVEDSLPVVLQLHVGTEAGATIAEQSVTVGPGRPAGFSIEVAALQGSSLKVTLRATAAASVAAGQRAVVDLSGVQILVAQRP